MVNNPQSGAYSTSDMHIFDRKSPVPKSLQNEVCELCRLHDHITRVVAGLEFLTDRFSDQYSAPSKARFEFEPVLKMFLYMKTRDISQPELHRRLKGTAYLWIRFGLDGVPTQQAISYIWRNRLSLTDRHMIRATAQVIREIAADHGILSDDEPRLDPGRIDSTDVTDDHIMNAIEAARDRGLDEFDSGRAGNATLEDIVFFERQGYLNMADRGTTTRSNGSNGCVESLDGGRVGR
jgi:hypothetical protein